ncbi:MAG: bifunctional diguanylate cyclase/phosphodiesterase [Gammaproteobacteria bacterium]|nr:MAG: bifunctional diguanylate cyclase/phosphodiesterase [Gammaproteobacteria bacterium]
MDTTKQYPAMSLSAYEMNIPQGQLSANLGILINEIENGDFEPESAQLYPLVLKTNTLWAKAISQNRIYLANRLASFTTEILYIQAESLQAIAGQIEANLKILENLYLNETGSFEGSQIIQSSFKALNSWVDYFNQVRNISESPYWRRDSFILESSIIPLIDQITTALQAIDNQLRIQDIEAANLLKQSSNKVFITLALIIFLFLIFIITILVSLELMIFKPISNVVLALRSKAFGMEGPQFHKNHSLETHLLIEAFQEMDQQVNNREKALEHQALHDALTTLPNRVMLNEHLEYHLSAARRNQKNLTLFVLDLDRFKDVNDSLGHQTGDLLLIEVARRLNSCVREIDTVARLGGDEFAVILPNTKKHQSEVIAEKIGKSLTGAFTIDSQTIHVGVSIGIASYPDDGLDGQTLLQHADIAMYSAKQNRVEFSHYDAREDQFSLNRIALINDLHTALQNKQLQLHFQPQIDLINGNVVGAEALLRWEHQEFGYIRAEKIIELAEHSGIINDLTTWIIEHAVLQCKQWHNLGHSLSVSVNLSIQNLLYQSLCNEVEHFLNKCALESRFLILEITENSMMANPGRSIEVLKYLHNMGVRLSIDDFGTGFSSLSYLKQLPVQEVKIDKSFVMDMEHDINDATIVQSIIDLGHNLGMKVVAEGVENENNYRALKKLNCDLAQGYLIEKPMPVGDFVKWLESRKVNDNLETEPEAISQAAMT